MKNWEEVLYNDLNKSYGSYQLRKKYAKYLFFGFLISLCLLIVPILIIHLKNHVTNNFETFPYMVTSEFEVPIDLDLMKTPPPPPSPEQEPEEETEKVPEIVDTIKSIAPKKVELEKKKLEIEKDSNDVVNKNNNNGNGFNANGDSAIFFIYVDNLPEFPGGKIALSQFISQNTIYPDSAQKRNIEGYVIVQFIITKYGDVRDISVFKSTNPLMAKEAIRVVNLFPKWQPGRRGGKPVNVKYQIPFNFKIHYTKN